MKNKHRCAFTLVELIVVIAILAILAAASMSRWVDLQNKAKESSDETIITALKEGMIHEHANNVC